MSRLPYLIVLIIILGIVSPYWFSYGMFMDGLIYSTVSMNLHQGLGSFWDPQFTPYLHPHFHEHPPLGMFIQSGLYSFSNSPLIDRWYSIITLLLSGWALTKIWSFLQPDQKQLGYWPLLFWGTTPLVIWALPNNLLENLMGLWVLLAILFQWKSFRENNWKLSITVGLLWTLSFYTKGPVGLFPIALGPILWLLQLEGRAIIFKQFSISLITALILFFAPYFLNATIQHSWDAYFQQQIGNSLRNVVTVQSRFYILFQTFNHAIPTLAFIVMGWLYWRKKIQLHFDKKTIAVFLLGLSGIVPMMISLKQREFYLLPAWPLIILGLSLMATPVLKNLHEHGLIISKKWGIGIALILFAIAFGVALKFSGTCVRDRKTQLDLAKIAQHLPEQKTFHFTQELHDDYSLIGYAFRYYKIGLDPFEHREIVISSENKIDLLGNYHEISMGLQKLHVFQKMP
jgi:hypothetical protein